MPDMTVLHNIWSVSPGFSGTVMFVVQPSEELHLPGRGGGRGGSPDMALCICSLGTGLYRKATRGGRESTRPGNLFAPLNPPPIMYRDKP